VTGGYEIQVDLGALPLYDLIAIVDCDGHASAGAEAVQGKGGCGCLEHVNDWSRDQHLVRFARSGGPVQALQFKVVEFFRGIRVADLVQPGRRIDVPSGRLRLRRTRKATIA
jgi:hypothetical protein